MLNLHEDWSEESLNDLSMSVEDDAEVTPEQSKVSSGGEDDI